MSKPFKGLLVTKKEAKIRTINGDLNTYYDLLECDTIDITSIKFGDKFYDIICDDEGLFKPDNHVSICSSEGSPMIVGNIIVCNHNEEGEETSLSLPDCVKLLSRVAWSEQNGEGVPVLIASV